MRRLPIAFLALLLLATPIFATTGGAAPVTPPGSAFGLEPPPGYALANGFSGFASGATPGASIVINEMPAAAYAQMERGLDAALLAARGIDMAGRESFTTPSGAGVLVTGTQRVGERSFAKWLLVVSAADATGLVVATVPGPADAATDAAMRTALASLVHAPVPMAAKRDALPFRLEEGKTLRIANVLGGSSAVLTPGGTMGQPGTPMLAIAFGPGAVIAPANRVQAASAMLRQVAGVSGITLGTPVEKGDSVAIEAEGTDAAGTKLRVAQWVTFQADGYLRVVALAPADAFATLLPEFSAIAASVVRK